MINNKKEIKKLEKFSKKFAKKHCEKERVNLTALVGLDSRKIEPYENSDFSIVKVKCIASLKGSDVSQNEVTLFFFYNDKTSISQLEQYFACPYAFFVKYGLRLKENKKAAISSPDIGTIIHKFVELFIQDLDKFEGLEEAEFEKKAKEIFDETLETLNINLTKT